MVLFQRKGHSSIDLNINYGGDELEAGQCTAGPWHKNQGPHVQPIGKSGARRPTKHEKSGRSTVTIAQFVIIGVLSFLCCKSHQEVSARRSQLTVLYSEYQNTQETLSGLETELDKAHEDFHRLQMSMLAEQASMPKIHHSEFTDDHRENVANGIILKDSKQAERINQLQKKIQMYHKQELERRFGPGPYYVEFKVSMDGSPKWFTLETASNDIMPHSVYYFMDMVDKKVWDNTVFVHDEVHFLSTVLASPEGEDKKHLVDSVLAFPEYSDVFHHEPYTFGFSNLGPQFYLNFHEDAKSKSDDDPCFARVVIGGESIKQLKQRSEETKGEEKIYTTIETVRNIILSPERKREIGTPVTQQR